MITQELYSHYRTHQYAGTVQSLLYTPTCRNCTVVTVHTDMQELYSHYCTHQHAGTVQSLPYTPTCRSCTVVTVHTNMQELYSRYCTHQYAGTVQSLLYTPICRNCTVVTVHTNMQEPCLICSTNLLPMNAHSNKLDLPCKAVGSTTQNIAICIIY